jgi:hypothetical protein
LIKAAAIQFAGLGSPGTDLVNAEQTVKLTHLIANIKARLGFFYGILFIQKYKSLF